MTGTGTVSLEHRRIWTYFNVKIKSNYHNQKHIHTFL